MKHPFVRYLEKGVQRLSLLKDLDPSEGQRFTQVVRSLAIPITMLMRGGNVVHNTKVRESFMESITTLRSLKIHEDQHLDLIKFDSSLLFQRGVNDIDVATGHVALKPSASLDNVLDKRVFRGFVGMLVARQVRKAQGGELPARCFLASYLLSKRGWPELCLSKRLQTVLDHQTYLAKEPAVVPTELLEEIRKTCNKIFRNTTLKKLSPSRHASYLSSRKAGGAWGEVVSHPPPMFHWTDLVHSQFRAQDREVLLYDVRSEAWKADTLRGVVLDDEFSHRPSIREVNMSIIDWRNDLWNELCDEAAISRTYRRVRAQVIPEPGKFRMITAGDGFQYTWLQPLQGSLLLNWAGCRYSTMTANWEEEVELWKAPDGWVWNSGDYKAATDQLNMFSTLEAMAAISKIYGLPADFDHGLDGVEVEYTAKDAVTLPRVIWQKNGQLMGHPLSFPILCVINLAGLSCAINRGIARGVISREDRPKILSMTKINGDDILFPCPPALCRIWEDTAAELGLVLSTGKSYASKDFAMVNNVMFNKRGEGASKRIGYLNQKLILNFSLKGGESLKSPFEIGHAFNKMFRDCPKSTTFLSDCVSNRKELPIYGYQPNFFVSCALGGLGVDPQYADREIYVTGLQRQVASLFAEGVMNSYLFATGTSDRGLLGKLMRSLPPVRVSTGAGTWEMDVGVATEYRRTEPDEQHALHFLETFGLVPQAGGGLVLNPEAKNSYQRMVGLLSQFQTPEEKTPRKLDRKKLTGVRPMRLDKVLSLSPKLMFPVLPRIEGVQSLRYRTELRDGAPVDPVLRKPEFLGIRDKKPLTPFHARWRALEHLATLTGRSQRILALKGADIEARSLGQRIRMHPKSASYP
jgi:hypothetical protein